MSTAPTLTRVVELPTHPRKCKATNNAGEPCGQWAIIDGTVCRYHGGSAPQVQAAARRKAIWHAPRAVEVLVELMENPLTEDTVRRAAARDILDRAGVGPHSVLELQDDKESAKKLKALGDLSDADFVRKLDEAKNRILKSSAAALENVRALEETAKTLTEVDETIAEQERLGVPDTAFMEKLLALRQTCLARRVELERLTQGA